MMYDLEACHEELQNVEDERDVWKARAEAAERRVAELEAALKAGEWRPVTEKPDADMDVEMIVIGMYKSDDNVFWDEYFGAMVEPTHWRPAPPQE